jgi:cytoplasmic iron level regulating protein YaaA (DUF328/UPF0246 family)
MSSWWGIGIKQPKLMNQNPEKIKKERQIAEENFKKMYRISDEVYEKNFVKKDKP